MVASVGQYNVFNINWNLKVDCCIAETENTERVLFLYVDIDMMDGGIIVRVVVLLYKVGASGTGYLTAFNFRAPLIFTRLRCAKIKGAIFAVEWKNNRPKTKNCITDVRGARKLETRKLKARKLKARKYEEREN